MSRVRDALKRANTLTPPAEIAAPPLEVSKAALAWEEFTEGLASQAIPAAAASTSAPEGRSKPRYHPLLRNRWVRRLLRLAGVRPPHVPVQKCQGMTRQGQPCRGPAMANGYCRLHGGSRQLSVVAKTRDMLDRVLPAR